MVNEDRKRYIMLGQTKPGMKKEHLYSVNTEKKQYGS